MKQFFYSLLSLLFIFPAQIPTNTKLIQDPFTNYLATTAHSKTDSVLSFTIKFDENQEYLFLSLNSLSTGKEGNTWEVYSHKKDGYELVNVELPPLRRDMLAFGTMKGIDGDALITFLPDNPERGNLETIQIKDNKITTHTLDAIEPFGKDKDLYSKIFVNEKSRVSVSEQTII